MRRNKNKLEGAGTYYSASLMPTFVYELDIIALLAYTKTNHLLKLARVFMHYWKLVHSPALYLSYYYFLIL